MPYKAGNWHVSSPEQYFLEHRFLDICQCVFNDIWNRVCVQNKTKGLNTHILNMIRRINESNILTKHISWKCECKFDGRKCNSNQKWNNNKYQCECKNLKEHNAFKKGYIWNSATCSCENVKYVGSLTDDSVIMCDQIN